MTFIGHTAYAVISEYKQTVDHDDRLLAKILSPD